MEILNLALTLSLWQKDALCQQHSTNLFFPPPTFEKKDDRVKREFKAKAVCDGCPVKINCLHEAMSISEPFGIWGGLTETERKQELLFK